MNATTDLDRALAEWLADGPVRAPGPPVAAAIEHARSHPRRRDPFAALRRDPMASRRGPIVGGRATLALAAVGLLVVAVAGFAIVGSQPSVVTPGPTASPVASGSPTPSLAPTPAPITVSIIDPRGAEVTATVEDASGLLVGASSSQPSDGGVVAGGELAISNDGPNRLRLEWTDLPCGTGYRVTIDAGATAIAVSREACGGDLLPTDRIVVLDFSGPIDAANVAGSVDLPVQGGG